MLKRHAANVCEDLTRADALQIRAHLARLDLISEFIRHAGNHGLVDDQETVRSERQLCNPLTLCDWQEVLTHTRKCHRAPAYLNQKSELDTINGKLDLIAGLLSKAIQYDSESEVQP